MIQPYLIFEGRCEEAIEFYKKALCAEVTMLVRFKDCPESPREDCPLPAPEKVMHANLSVKGSTLLVSDGQCGGSASFQGFSLSVDAESEAEAQNIFVALGDGGEVQMPLMKTFFSPCFGMLKDRFGVVWMVIVHPPAA